MRAFILAVSVFASFSAFAAVDQNGYVCYVTGSNQNGESTPYFGRGVTPNAAYEQALQACGQNCDENSLNTAYCE